MAGMSMWGTGSNYEPGPGYLQPMMTGRSGNPFDSPMSEHMSMRAPTYYMPYPQPSMLGMGAPRNTIMSGLGGYGTLDPQNRMSSAYSLASTANPLGTGPKPITNDNPNPTDVEVLTTLRQYLASQDLMSV